jgi:tyrosine-protein kinase Etk/Wzc
LDFIATGTLPANPNDILLNSRLHSWLERWAASYDMVILDTPPILAVSDPSVLAPQVGALLLVVREGQTSLAEVHESVKRFTQAGTSVTGVLMNGVRARLSPYGYGSKRYRYTSHAYDSYRPQPEQANPE